MEWLIALVVIAAVVAGGLWARRAFAPEIERARRIRRAERGGRLER
ncbi:hypothetical protein KW076_05450 [Micrococcus porci]|nr:MULTISPECIES: hypothetical protein [Micrococcus]MCG7421475.1 hypothetical protein [Micrococcus sp. ACRRV]UBH25623.1 hypothetical protein KW076_05450 [Micrococcus porci]